jgi:hypothetical protein
MGIQMGYGVTRRALNYKNIYIFFFLKKKKEHNTCINVTIIFNCLGVYRISIT